MRLTRAGAGMVCATATCYSLGRIFGLEEFFYLTGMGLAALAIATVVTALAQLDLTVDRTATPSRLRVDAPARVDLRITNRSRRRTPMLALQDQVQDSTGAAISLAAIRGKRHTDVAYRLPTTKRGLLNVGPLHITVGDPFGLTRSKVKASGRVQLVVHAPLTDLGVLRATAGHDPTADRKRSRSLAMGGDEFFAMRPYVVGDDLRRVNWRASSRTEELVVRQQEQPQTGRVTVILDLQSQAYGADGFERSVSAALSVLHAAWKGGDALRFGTSGVGAFTEIRSRSELDIIDEQLALVQATSSASLIRSISQACQAGGGGTLVILTGRPSQEIVESIESARRQYGQVIAVACCSTDHNLRPCIVHDGSVSLPEIWASRNSHVSAEARG